MSRIFIVFIASVLITGCSQPSTFKVEGKITDNNFNGSKVFLVALDGPVTKNVDSTIIIDDGFHFNTTGDSLCVKILRVPSRYPQIIEDLVIITEPGTLHAVMSANSECKGTRLNNILQHWKNEKHAFDLVQRKLYARRKSVESDQKLSDSLQLYSKQLNSEYMSYVLNLQNENIHNGIGLLLFKLYINSFTPDEKKRILNEAGFSYLDKDAELKLMLKSEQTGGK